MVTQASAETGGPFLFDKAERDARNEKHLADPKPGDFWQERLNGVCVVAGKIGKQVLICRTKVDTDPHHWTWKLDELELLTLEEFREYLSYGDYAPGTWADVIPRVMMWVAEELSNLNEVNNEQCDRPDTEN